MKNKLKKIFENAVWWSGVVMVGLILGLTVQFVRAWTEPSDTPPGGNVGAPINTSGLPQIKAGVLEVLGLKTSGLQFPQPGVTPAVGDVLSASTIDGQVAWAAGGGGGVCYTQYCNENGAASYGEKCDWGGLHCPAPFQEEADLGRWGVCSHIGPIAYFSPPSGGCSGSHSYQWVGRAYLCCK